MSGLVGHSLYAKLAAQEAHRRRLPVAPLLLRHEPTFLAGAYIGCDIQVMPQAICVDTGKEVGFGTVPIDRSPITGGSVKPWTLSHRGTAYTPKQIHELFYGRAHLVFGWPRAEANLAIPWDHLDDYCSLAMRDQLKQEPANAAAVAYLFGWMVHIVSDSLIKSIQPGVRMRLLDGTYTARNRPIQDLFAFHEIGIKDLKLDWAQLFQAMAATTVEQGQFHYMRIAEPQAELGRLFTEGWQPKHAGLLGAVLKENRRWLQHHAKDVLTDMALNDSGEVTANVRKTVGEDLTYAELMAMAERAHLRDTLSFITDSSVALFEQVQAKVPALQRL
jgi:hypothetical protein